MEIIDTLESLTRQIYSKWERESLRNITSKITKSPDSINMSVEYIVDKLSDDE